jgi:hypothetical protein
LACLHIGDTHRAKGHTIVPIVVPSAEPNDSQNDNGENARGRGAHASGGFLTSARITVYVDLLTLRVLKGNPLNNVMGALSLKGQGILDPKLG